MGQKASTCERSSDQGTMDHQATQNQQQALFESDEGSIYRNGDAYVFQPSLKWHGISSTAPVALQNMRENESGQEIQQIVQKNSAQSKMVYYVKRK